MEKIRPFKVGEKVKLFAAFRNDRYDIITSYRMLESVLSSLQEISAEIIGRFQMFEGVEGTIYMCRVPENSIGFTVSNWHVIYRHVNEKHLNYKFVEVPGWAMNCSLSKLKELIDEN